MAFEPEIDKDLTQLTTFGLKSCAQYFAKVTTLTELDAALDWAQAQACAVHILGGGANTIAMPRVPGLTIQVAFNDLEILHKDEAYEVILGAGHTLETLVRIGNSLHGGFENLTSIPGSVGGAIVQNAGAYGLEISERLLSVEVYGLQSRTIRTLTPSACDFTYRHSIFKTPEKLGEAVVIVRARFECPVVWQPRIGYKGLEDLSTIEHLTPQMVSDRVAELRAQKLPDYTSMGNAGSFFMNPIVSALKAKKLVERIPKLVTYPLSGQRVKLSAAQLIDHLGLKGYRQGQVGVSAQHALVLVNYDGATGDEVVALQTYIQKRVAEHYGIDLMPEPVLLG